MVFFLLRKFVFYLERKRRCLSEVPNIWNLFARALDQRSFFFKRKLPHPRFLIRGFSMRLWANAKAGTWEMLRHAGTTESIFLSHSPTSPPCPKNQETSSQVLRNQDKASVLPGRRYLGRYLENELMVMKLATPLKNSRKGFRSRESICGGKRRGHRRRMELGNSRRQSGIEQGIILAPGVRSGGGTTIPQNALPG